MTKNRHFAIIAPTKSGFVEQGGMTAISEVPMRTIRRGWSCLVLSVGCLLGVATIGEAAETALEREAKAQAEQFYGRYVTLCGKDAYRRHWVSDKGQWVEGGTQFRNWTFVVEPREVTPADRLNGVEWKGWVTFQAQAFRPYTAKDRRWLDEWRDGGAHSTQFPKRHGQWTVHADDAMVRSTLTPKLACPNISK
jgi:hypothetical protein